MGLFAPTRNGSKRQHCLLVCRRCSSQGETQFSTTINRTGKPLCSGYNLSKGGGAVPLAALISAMVVEISPFRSCAGGRCSSRGNSSFSTTINQTGKPLCSGYNMDMEKELRHSRHSEMHWWSRSRSFGRVGEAFQPRRDAILHRNQPDRQTILFRIQC